MADEDTIDPEAMAGLEALGGLELVRNMIDLFGANTPARLAAVKAGLESDDRQEARRAAHSMKSTAASMGARRLAALAAQVEALLAAPGATPDLTRAVGELEREADRVAARLGEIRAGT
ncbi:MAG: Hpt domain-containing protein [Candidatus Riflebacteria bacterium]|nr:Hpt domain-containing protein [Candidatus Riflebacteria bacterium]